MNVLRSFNSSTRHILRQPIVSRNTIRAIMTKTEEEWRAILSPEQFRVLRERGTEIPNTGEYTKTPASDVGIYECVGCGQPLYKALTKFIAHCGWPAFYDAIPGSIKVYRDDSLGRLREEMRCSNCDGHLGHIFKGEGYSTPTDTRHCMNSVSIKFNPEDSESK